MAFQSPPQCPRGHSVGYCTAGLGIRAHRPCLGLSVLSSICPSVTCLSHLSIEWIDYSQPNCLTLSFSPASPFPPLSFVDSLDGELWYPFWIQSCCFGLRAPPRPVGQVFFRQLFTTRSTLDG